ncbi:MAG: Wzt carbohydrate-binding domain-containing protein, partial [Ruminococcus sp.]|nr:Wzt carbohydrate-binding domain-containing protein [Ruminococcus sp.]
LKRNQELVDGVKLTSISIADKNEWRIKVGEKIRFNITVKASKEIKNVAYRSRLIAADGTSITVLLAPNLFSCKAGDEITIPLEADVSQLVPGKYKLTPVLYGVNEYGGWNFYDHIDGAVTFEVETVEGFNQNMEWQSRWWGNVKFPEIKDLRNK